LDIVQKKELNLNEMKTSQASAFIERKKELETDISDITVCFPP